MYMDGYLATGSGADQSVARIALSTSSTELKSYS